MWKWRGYWRKKGPEDLWKHRTSLLGAFLLGKNLRLGTCKLLLKRWINSPTLFTNLWSHFYQLAKMCPQIDPLSFMAPLLFCLSEVTTLSLDAVCHGNSIAVMHNYLLFLSQRVILDTDIFRSFQQSFKSWLVWSNLFSCSVTATLQCYANSWGKARKEENQSTVILGSFKALKKEIFISLPTHKLQPFIFSYWTCFDIVPHGDKITNCTMTARCVLMIFLNLLKAKCTDHLLWIKLRH